MLSRKVSPGGLLGDGDHLDNRAVSPAFGSIDRICSASLNGPSWIV
jgi:hypothetical protein